MDKETLINDILNEWAMRSPDGLVGGHDSPENIFTLKKLLMEYASEYGLDDNDVEEVMHGMFGEAVNEGEDAETPNRSELRAAETPDYVDLFKGENPITKKFDILVTADGKPFKGKAMQHVGYYLKYTPENLKRAEELSEKDPFWIKFQKEKRVDLERKKRMKQAFEKIETTVPKGKNAAIVKRFKNMYDTIPSDVNGVQHAITIYQGGSYKGVNYSEFLPIINEVDKLRPNGTGRGELVFLFLLKGMKTGGTRQVDLIYGEKDTMVKREKGIEVKEISKASVISISTPTFEGFPRSKFNGAVHEFALATTRLNGLDEFLQKILVKKSAGNLVKAAIDKFVKEPKVGEISQNFLKGLFMIRNELQTINVKPDKFGNAPINATMDIDIGDVEKEFQIINPAVVLPQVQSIGDGTSPTKLNMKVAYTKEQGDDYLQHALMKLSFFREYWSMKKINDEMMGLLLTNYSKMLVVDKRATQNSAELYQEPQMSKLVFDSLGFGKVDFKAP